MPVHSLCGFTSVARTDAANRRLGVAGAANAGGFLAIGQRTSHTSGMVSTLADSLTLGNIAVVLSAASAIFVFLAGAFAFKQARFIAKVPLAALLLLTAVPVADDLLRYPRRVR